MKDSALPLSGLRVIEFTHMVMGPSAGVILGDLGADVIKIEPLQGDNTRRLKGSGAGYFPMYNRNKRSICVDLKSADGLALVHSFIEKSDIVIENFRPGAMDKLGLGYKDCEQLNDQIIYCSLKGFLSGPYEHRTALDEVTQMMGGLAHMTGLPDKPMRAGASVVDVSGGMFGVFGILAAVEKRHKTGKGEYLTSSLFESTVFLMGQHMAQEAVTGVAPPPMSQRNSAWAIYDIFLSSDNEKVFVAVVSDTLWREFCTVFELDDWLNDDSLSSNNGRVAARAEIMPAVEKLFKQFTKEQLIKKLDQIGLPYAPINTPSDLFNDEHLLAGGLLDLELPDGTKASLPALPIEFTEGRLPVRHQPPAAGEDFRDLASELGISDEEANTLFEKGVVK